MSDLSWLNPTPHAIAVYASQPLSPVATQHSLPSGRYSLTWAGLPPAGSHQLAAGALIRSPRRRASSVGGARNVRSTYNSGQTLAPQQNAASCHYATSCSAANLTSVDYLVCA